MAVPAQFNFIDGGERAPGNMGYYTPLGANAAEILSLNGKYYFYGSYGSTGSIVGYSPPGFSSKTAYWTWRGSIQGSSTALSIFNAEGSALLKLQFNANGSASLYSGATLLGTSPIGTFYFNTIFQMSFGGLHDPAAGTFVMYLNGNPVPVSGISVTGVNTAGGQSDYAATHFYLQGSNGGNQIYGRDMSVHDGTGAAPFNGPLGNCGAELTMPNGNVSSQLTPSTGSSNAAIYAATPPGAAYCGGSTVGQTDKVTIAALPTNVLSVIGFKAFDYAAKNDSGARAIQKSVISGATTAPGAENYLNETPVVAEDAYTADPATGAAITVAAYNALELTETIAA